MEKILFLDFDGVLFDTADEAYYVCRNTQEYKDYTFPDNSLELFRVYRPLVGPAWTYYYIMNAIVNATDILDKNSQFQLTSDAKAFEDDFFSTRARLKELNYRNWLHFNKKYTFLDQLTKKLDDKLKIYIITTKDEQTVIDLLAEHKIKLIKKENILGKEIFNQFGSKRNIILNILKNREYHAIFVDDLYSHLKQCEDIKNIQLIQADWGYIDKNHVSQYLRNSDSVIYAINKL